MKQMAEELEEIQGRMAELKPVATSGEYDDLTGKPTLGSGNELPIGEFAGQMFYYTSINKPIWWDGTAWKDSAGEAVTYPVTYNLTHLTSSNTRQPMAGQSYTTTLSVESSEYSLPGNIIVKIGSEMLDSNADYTWDDATGELAVLGTEGAGGITGVLTITAIAEEVSPE